MSFDDLENKLIYAIEKWLSKKGKFSIDCYYCIYEFDCKDAHSGKKDCNEFRGA